MASHSECEETPRQNKAQTLLFSILMTLSSRAPRPVLGRRDRPYVVPQRDLDANHPTNADLSVFQAQALVPWVFCMHRIMGRVVGSKGSLRSDRSEHHLALAVAFGGVGSFVDAVIHGETA
jgi:hypothetical protein